MKILVFSFIVFCGVLFRGNVLAQGIVTVDSAMAFDEAKTTSGDPGRISWIPHTHKLLYAIKAGGASNIYVRDLDTNTTRRVIEGGFPIPASNGKEFAFLKLVQLPDGKSGVQIWSANIDGTGAALMTTIPGEIGPITGYRGDFWGAWSPQSDKLAIHTLKVVVDPASFKPKNPDAPTAVVYPDSVRAALPVDLIQEVHIFSIPEKTDRIIITHTGEMGFDLQWLDESTLIYEQDNGNGHSSLNNLDAYIYRIDTASGKRRVLLHGYDRQTVYRMVLNPSHSQIAFHADPGGQIYPERRELAVHDMQTGKTTIFTRYAALGADLAWISNDAVAYINGSSTRRQIFVQLLDGKRTQLTHAPDFRQGLAASDDGRYLAWVSIAPNSMWAIHAGRLERGRLVDERRLAILQNPLAGMRTGVSRPFYWKSADGLGLDGLITLPVGYTAGKRVPVVVMVHGGPIDYVYNSQGEWPGDMAFVEYLAGQGYAVFIPDYRNSGNFGFDKILEDRTHHRAMQSDYTDILSGVLALERAGIADPHREAVIGHSYGGLEVNWIITHTAHFRAAVSYEAAEDWYHEWGTIFGVNSYYNWKLNGTPFTEPEVYRENSAITFAGNIRTPTLFINDEFGINSPSSAWLYTAALNNHVDTKYVFYQGEPHVVGKPVNKRDLFVRITQWIKEHLKP